MRIHAVAEIFPRMGEAEFVALKNDIAEHGVREPLWIWRGQIIDGRHRAQACEELGIVPAVREYDGDESGLVGFVVSLNLHRRHLDESQRAMVAGKLANLRDGQRADLAASIDAPSITQSQAAELLNVSRPSVQRAREVLDHGAPELVAAVERGEVSVSAAATIADAPKEEQAEIVARGEREILEAAKAIRTKKAEERRAERVEKIVEISKGNAPLGKVAELYPVIYADPPWRYEYIETESRAIENQYPTMALDEIKALDLDAIALDDCVLFMWATSPKLAEAFEVLASWGFEYRTCAVWDKQKIGMGYYFRQQHELLLVAVRGQPLTPAPANRPSSVLSFPRGVHSAKPVEVYELIEAMYPELPKLEMFCRSPREGWGAWGNQAAA
jgi:N6-adenosine-specific RNA methylase IME4/ParB-like chromosome segregation protein Spo0J